MATMATTIAPAAAAGAAAGGTAASLPTSALSSSSSITSGSTSSSSSSSAAAAAAAIKLSKVNSSPIVLDLGTAWIRCGVASEPTPRHIVPTPRFFAEWLTRPVSLAQWTARLTLLFRHLLFDVLLINPSTRRLYICESPSWPANVKRAIVTIAHTLGVPGLLFLPAHTLPVLCSSRASGLCVDVGEHETRVLPVHDHLPIYHAMQIVPVGVAHVKQALIDATDPSGQLHFHATLVNDLVAMHCFARAPAETRAAKDVTFTLSSHAWRTTPVPFLHAGSEPQEQFHVSALSARTIAARNLVCAQTRVINAYVGEASGESLAEASVASSSSSAAAAASSSSSSSSSSSPSSDATATATSSATTTAALTGGRPATRIDPPTIVTLTLRGTVRSDACEALFGRNDDQWSVQEAIAQALERCDTHARAVLSQNIVLCGGGAVVPGFAARLASALNDTFASPRHPSLHGLAQRFVFTPFDGVAAAAVTAAASSSTIAAAATSQSTPSTRLMSPHLVFWLGVSIVGMMEVRDADLLTRDDLEAYVKSWTRVERGDDVDEEVADDQVGEREEQGVSDDGTYKGGGGGGDSGAHAARTLTWSSSTSAPSSSSSSRSPLELPDWTTPQVRSLSHSNEPAPMVSQYHASASSSSRSSAVAARKRASVFGRAGTVFVPSSVVDAGAGEEF